MRLFKVFNKFMYKEKDPKKANGLHTYAVYKDKKTNKYRAIQLTHLLEPKKEKQINKGNLRVEKFKFFKFPTGVPKQYYDCDVNGKNLNFGKNTKHLFVCNVPSKQAQRIIKFATKRHK